MNDQKFVIDIRALAELARVELSDEEAAKLEKEIPGILAFVDQIQKIATGVPQATTPEVHNVMRADADPHESGIFTEALLRAAPAREGNRIAVKQVISRKRQ